MTHADRPFVEEVHFGSTPAEAARIWWDICWIWGPPEDHLQTLLGTVGAARFVLGTGQPLRLPENAGAKLDLLELSAADRAAIESANALALGGPVMPLDREREHYRIRYPTGGAPQVRQRNARPRR